MVGLSLSESSLFIAFFTALGEGEEDEVRVEVEGVTGAGGVPEGGVVGVEVVEVTREVSLEGFGVGEEEEVGAALRACSAKPIT